MEGKRTRNIISEAYEIVLQQCTPERCVSVRLLQSPLIVTVLILTLCVVDTVCI